MKLSFCSTVSRGMLLSVLILILSTVASASLGLAGELPAPTPACDDADFASPAADNPALSPMSPVAYDTVMFDFEEGVTGWGFHYGAEKVYSCIRADACVLMCGIVDRIPSPYSINWDNSLETGTMRVGYYFDGWYVDTCNHNSQFKFAKSPSLSGWSGVTQIEARVFCLTDGSVWASLGTSTESDTTLFIRQWNDNDVLLENGTWQTLVLTASSETEFIDITNVYVSVGAWASEGDIYVDWIRGLVPRQVPEIQLSPRSFTFTAYAGGANPPNQVLNISNSGDGTLNWSARDDATWLSLNPVNGIGNGSTNLIVNTAGLGAGKYSATVTVTDPAASNSPQTAAVTLNVLEQVPRISLEPTSLSFIAEQHGSVPESQTFTITNTGGGVLNWSVSETAFWLVASPVIGNNNSQVITVTVLTTDLIPDVYSANIFVASYNADNSPQIVSVTYEVLEADPSISLEPTSLSFSVEQHGAVPGSQTFTITNIGGGVLDWSVSETADWLTVDPIGGNTNSQFITVSVTTTDLIPDLYSTDIVVSSENADNSPQVVFVTYDVSEPDPRISLEPTSLSFSAKQHGTVPESQTFTITNIGGGVLDWSVSETAGWLEVDPVGGSGNSQDITVRVTTTDLVPDLYSAEIVVSSGNADNSPQVVSVTYDVSEPDPSISLEPESLSFQAEQGRSLPASEAFTITNAGGGTLEWSVSDDAEWLDENPASGVGNTETINVSVNTTDLTVGTHFADISVSSSNADNSPQQLLVTYTVDERTGADLRVSVTSLDFGADLDVMPLEITRDGLDDASWFIGDHPSWVSFSPDSGTVGSVGQDVTVTVDRSGQPTGAHSESVTINCAGNCYSTGFEISMYVRVSCVDPLTGMQLGQLPSNPIRIEFNGIIDDATIGNGLIITPTDVVGAVEHVTGELQSVLYIYPLDNEFSQLTEISVQSNTDLMDANLEYVEPFDLTFVTGAVVWPGNTNNDESVDERDILPIGQYFGSTGPFRSEGSLDWTGQDQNVVNESSSWLPYEAVYSDADGNGQIDADDICGITDNWLSGTTVPSKNGATDNSEGIQKALSQLGRTVLAELHDAVIDCPPSPGRSRIQELLESLLDKQQAILPDNPVLFQNFPNPFNPSTTIEFYLPQSGEIELTVHNILGQQVASLYSGYHESGYCVLNWDGTDESGNVLSNGMYFYRLTTNSWTQSRTMMLLK